MEIIGRKDWKEELSVLIPVMLIDNEHTKNSINVIDNIL